MSSKRTAGFDGATGQPPNTANTDQLSDARQQGAHLFVRDGGHGGLLAWLRK
jgi:hypothetical protein